MCMSIINMGHIAHRAPHKENGMYVGWKVVIVTDNGSAISPYRNFKWKKGLNKSDRKENFFTIKESISGTIDKGFHCFFSKKDATEYIRFRRSFIKVLIDPRDVVGLGRTSLDLPTILATQVTWDGVVRHR
jgi:hypothetical protein